ncbi:hypothetical protein N9C30_00065 [bacterium]|nr:hypothetical protein [bacterium]
MPGIDQLQSSRLQRGISQRKRARFPRCHDLRQLGGGRYADSHVRCPRQAPHVPMHASTTDPEPKDFRNRTTSG